MFTLKRQKYIVLTFLLFINLITITTFIVYADKWYVYLFILALATVVNASSVLLLLGHKMWFNPPKIQDYRVKSANYTYIVPCYNESSAELMAALDSLATQHRLPDDQCSLIIICDGKVIGNGNLTTTDIILKDLLTPDDSECRKFEYTTWDREKNTIEIYQGVYKDLPYLLFIKEQNYGKRDSLVLARKLCYNFNEHITEDVMINTDMMFYLGKYLSTVYNNRIDYMIGIDADTVFDYNCSYELIKTIEEDETVQGGVGFVDICPKMNPWNIFVLYQYAEYWFAQCLRRQAQSLITGKVSCLSGCNQILRVSYETCGETILARFNHLPKDDEHIFHHIRSYASEDRNHVCLMLSMYPNVKTLQSLKAIAYTVVPTSISVYMSQRRRWSLGANANDLMLTYLPGINIFERISAGVNVLTYSLAPFISVATGYFIHSIIIYPTYLMLYLSIPILIILWYAIIIPLFIKPLAFRSALYYYLSFILFMILGNIINLCIYVNSVCNMDVIKWGKTRSLVQSNVNKPDSDLEYDDFFYDNVIKMPNLNLKEAPILNMFKDKK